MYHVGLEMTLFEVLTITFPVLIWYKKWIGLATLYPGE
ncbi:hypothetical protein SAMN05192559_101205 [Halobacillus karajensis]|nr:hypothetical protein SAMN05192559_101205 [Halobacillus karajensis]